MFLCKLGKKCYKGTKANTSTEQLQLNKRTIIEIESRRIAHVQKIVDTSDYTWFVVVFVVSWFLSFKTSNQFNYGFDKLYISMNKDNFHKQDFFSQQFFPHNTDKFGNKAHSSTTAYRHKNITEEAQHGETPTLMTCIGKSLVLRCFTHWCTDLDLLMCIFIVFWFCFLIQLFQILCYTFFMSWP